MKPGDRLRAIGPALVLLAFVLAYFVIGYTTLDAASRQVPLLAAVVTAALLVFDIGRTVLRRHDSARPARHLAAAAPQAPPSVRTEITVLGSVVAAVVGIYLVGFLIAMPLYLFAAITLIGGRPKRVAAAAALATTLFIYAAFAWLLSYRLFPGVLFS
jgi:hypothetical protein